jgi:hypothetical protein
MKGAIMLATVTIGQNALPVVRSSIALKRQALELNLRAYGARLTAFEERYRMTSEKFEARFNAGELGDDPEWFEWEFAQDGYREAEHQLELLNSVELSASAKRNSPHLPSASTARKALQNMVRSR